MIGLSRIRCMSVCIFAVIIFNVTASSLALRNQTELSVSRNSARAAALKILKNEDCLGSRSSRVQCCRMKLMNYPKRWFSGGYYLQNLFNELKILHCPQILREFCLGMLYAKLSHYSNLVYQYHCDPQQFQKECTVTIARNRNLNESFPWEVVMKDFDSSAFTTDQLKQPCMQVASFDSSSGGYGFYHEMVAFDIPFCSNVWCGFDAKIIKEQGISLWSCISSRCHAGIIIISVFCSVLAVAIVVANITVIVVFATTPKIRNSQALYKISLAAADLIVGVIVIPSMIHSLITSYQGRLQLGDVIQGVPKNSDGILPQKPIASMAFRFSSEYIGFIGFSTSLSLLVSIYTLMMASFDRLFAISNPFKYSRHRAKTVAKWSSLSLWIAGIFFSVLPIFIREMPYGVIASVLILSLKTPGLIMYAVVLLLPLALVWITTINAYVIMKKQALVRSNLSVRRGITDGNSESSSLEAKLARTLATMVGIFTACLLPAVITLLIPLGISYIDPSYPRKFNPTANKTFTSTEFVAILIFLTNSLWNCLIYNGRNKEFKRKAKYLFMAICTTHGRRKMRQGRRALLKLPDASRKSSSATDFPYTNRKSIDISSVNASKENSVPTVYRYTREETLDQN